MWPAGMRAGADDTLATFDHVLDTRVRDGYVYYRALKADRQELDRYVSSLDGAELPHDRQAQIAFWLNAYNAIVLQAVINHYPIATRTKAFPARSIRQIPSVLAAPHRVAGRSLSLDAIEQRVLAAFKDPRIFFALGRGAAGGGRLRSEVYAAAEIERQLDEQAAECATRDRCVRVDPKTNVVRVSAVFSWRRDAFVDAFAKDAAAVSTRRPPLERAVIAFISPRLAAEHREFLALNRFRVEYLPFDWSLNDLATRPR